MAQDKPVDTFEEVFEDEEAPKEAQSMHRIRANSSIMQLKKILGMCLRTPRDAWKLQGRQFFVAGSSQVVGGATTDLCVRVFAN